MIKSSIKLGCAVFAALMLVPMIASAATITVDDSGSAAYTSIQAAVNAASAGDTILVWPGTYKENVDVNKQLTLASTAGASVTKVIAASANDHVFHVIANGVTISGFNVSGATGSEKAGVYLYSSINNTLTNNTAENNCCGIYLYYSSNNTLTSNTAQNNTDYGIVLGSSSSNTLTNNTANNNYQTGIDLYSSINNTLTSNTAENNYCGICLSDSRNNTLTSNTANNDRNGICLGHSSHYNTLTNNTAQNNFCGIYLYFSSNNNTLTNNTANNNHYGIWLSVSSHCNTLTNNTAQNNTDYGICLSDSSHYNTLTNNTAENNYNGIYLYSSNNNFIYNNYFNNTNNIDITESNNYWNITKTEGTNIVGGPSLGGNFWAHPDGTGFSQTGVDSDADGICDEKYTLSGGNIDHLPLAYPTNTPNDWNPWNNPDSQNGESISLSELQEAIYDWRFGITLSTGELVDLTRLQELIYSWRFGG